MRFKSCDTCLCACAFQQRARDRETACPGGGVSVVVTREFERRVTSEILQSDWTIPNPAGKSTKVPRPSFVRESREGLGPNGIQVEVNSVTTEFVHACRASAEQANPTMSAGATPA